MRRENCVFAAICSAEEKKPLKSAAEMIYYNVCQMEKNGNVH